MHLTGFCLPSLLPSVFLVLRNWLYLNGENNWSDSPVPYPFLVAHICLKHGIYHRLKGIPFLKYNILLNTKQVFTPISTAKPVQQWKTELCTIRCHASSTKLSANLQLQNLCHWWRAKKHKDQNLFSRSQAEFAILSRFFKINSQRVNWEHFLWGLWAEHK